MTTPKYGAWAVVAGASEGLGEAFAEALAARGHSLILLARRREALETVADRIRGAHRVAVKTVACDLADERFVDALRSACQGEEIGVGVYNAAYSYLGPFLDKPVEEALRVVDVNIRGPLRFVHELAPSMVQRRRGALVLMSSITAFQGVPGLATYAASKAFNLVLGESLWGELRPRGVDVTVCCAGAIRTPGYTRSAKKDAPGMLEPAVVAEQALRGLGRGPLVVPGALNKVASFVFGRVVSRAAAVSMMGKSTAANVG